MDWEQEILDIVSEIKAIDGELCSLMEEWDAVTNSIPNFHCDIRTVKKLRRVLDTILLGEMPTETKQSLLSLAHKIRDQSTRRQHLADKEKRTVESYTRTAEWDKQSKIDHHNYRKFLSKP